VWCSRQVALGIEIGLFYSARFLLLGSIWESIALHVANNVIAMCIPIKDATTFSHPLVLISRTFPHLTISRSVVVRAYHLLTIHTNR
jgi:membrane protease YdiL (CAAX protease family)